MFTWEIMDLSLILLDAITLKNYFKYLNKINQQIKDFLYAQANWMLQKIQQRFLWIQEFSLLRSPLAPAIAVPTLPGVWQTLRKILKEKYIKRKKGSKTREHN